VKGRWTYLYRAVDKQGRTVDFLLSEKRDTVAAKRFFSKAMKNNGTLRVITLDTYAASHRAVAEMQSARTMPRRVGVRSNKYRNNIIEQDHRRIKHRIGPMLGFNSSASTRQRSRSAVSNWQRRSGSNSQNRKATRKTEDDTWNLSARSGSLKPGTPLVRRTESSRQTLHQSRVADEEDSGAPVLPHCGQPGPQESISACKFRPLHGPLKNAELMAEGEDLKLKRRTAPGCGQEGREERRTRRQARESR
jgi:hypothetical protein